MLVRRTQSEIRNIRPQIKRVATETVDKLSRIKFDIRSNKFITEPYKDLFQKRCGDGEGTYTIVCDNEPVDVMAC